MSKPAKSLNEGRFRTSGLTLFVDRGMTGFIVVGGISVIIAVMGIFVFITWKIVPLFKQAKVHQVAVTDIPVAGEITILGVDEWTELPFVVTEDNRMHFIDLEHGGELRSEELPIDGSIASVSYVQRYQKLVVGTDHGTFQVVSLNYKDTHAGDTRRIVYALEASPAYELSAESTPVEQIAYGEGSEQRLVVGLQRIAGEPHVLAATLVQKRSLFGPGKISVGGQFDLTAHIDGHPARTQVSANGDTVLVANDSGTVYVFTVSSEEAKLTFTIRPFEGATSPQIASMNYLLGDASIVFTNPDGLNRVFTFFTRVVTQDDGSTRVERCLEPTKTFPPLAAGATTYAASMRNKAFLLTDGRQASLRYNTTEAVRWQQDLDFEPQFSVISNKFDSILFADTQKKLHIFKLEDKHPEAGVQAFFGRLWYEGQSEPKYLWQSTGGSEDFEPKLSMVPLIWGTLKATFYAMLFALPVSLLAAMYTSQFMHPNFKKVVKPTMEVMASLPSVVLGFLGALWLAPRVEDKVPAILAAVILVPLSAVLVGIIWARLPMRYRAWCKPGYEFLVFVPIAIGTLVVAYLLGPLLENLVFGGDFRTWWRADAFWSATLGYTQSAVGFPYEQKNAMLVGFMMAFAVIPIIFSIAEDAMSNVPQSLISASLALGASRWQTAVRVVLPTASAGMFSAIMIGLGRAVGETMIVLMLCGNTAIMELNIFNGMRPLSANIATELPEAPENGTLYRALFLGGFILFVMTFVLNTLAEFLRHHLRNKYKTV